MGEVSNEAGDGIDLGKPIPIFPLPNAVLLPRVVMPLHIFEDRYRCLMRDALAGQRAICVALLKPGYEAKYHTLTADIHPVVGVGRILKNEQTPDGRYYFLLQGLHRGRVIQEDHSGEYRRALLEPIPLKQPSCEEECRLRREIRSLLQSPPLEGISKASRWHELFQCGDLTFSDLLDLLASSLLSSPEKKQSFLAEPCVQRRAAVVSDTLKLLSNELIAVVTQSVKSRPWPPPCCDN